MSTDLVPFTYEGTAVRTLLIDGDVWFVLADLCAVLDIRNPTMVAQRLDPDGLSQAEVIDSMGRRQMATVVNEPAMYEVVIRSDKPEAVTFRRWITSTVLPEIRRTGSFTPLTREQRIALAMQDMSEIIAEQRTQIAIMAPKVEVADRLLEAEGDYAVADAAKALTRAGIKVGEGRLFNALDTKYGWIYRARGDGRWRVYQTAIESGHMSVIPQTHYHPKTGVLVLDPPQPRITPKGMQKILIDHGGES